MNYVSRYPLLPFVDFSLAILFSISLWLPLLFRTVCVSLSVWYWYSCLFLDHDRYWPDYPITCEWSSLCIILIYLLLVRDRYRLTQLDSDLLWVDLSLASYWYICCCQTANDIDTVGNILVPRESFLSSGTARLRPCRVQPCRGPWAFHQWHVNRLRHHFSGNKSTSFDVAYYTY